MPLLVNFMKLRGKERHRSFLGAKLGGKSIRDAFHYNPVSLNAPAGNGNATLGDFVAGYDRDPFGQCIVAGFEDDLTTEQSKVAEQMISGYNDTEASRNLYMNPIEHHRVKLAVMEKAIEHLG
jgi:ABC-type dipeptide/oligopeptide/nickel transport system ATPase subunit